MRGCEHALQSIVRQVDGVITPAGRDDLQRHLAHCATCQDEAEAQAVVRAILQSRPPEPMPHGFAERLAARLAAVERPFTAWIDRMNWRKWSMYLLPLTAVLLLVALREHARKISQPLDLVAAVTDPRERADGLVDLLTRSDVSSDSLLMVLVTNAASVVPSKGKP